MTDKEKYNSHDRWQETRGMFGHLPPDNSPGLLVCPLRLALNARNGAMCNKEKCAWWNEEKGRCGVIK